MFSEPVREGERWVSVQKNGPYRLVAEAFNSTKKGTEATVSLYKNDELLLMDHLLIDAEFRRKKFIYHTKDLDPKLLDQALIDLKRAFEAEDVALENRDYFMASHPDLVDLVEQDGKTGFCLVVDGKLKFQTVFQTGNAEQHPPRNIPWLLPRYRK